MKKIRLLNILFANNLSFTDIPKYRGAVIIHIEDKDIYYLFHNHIHNGFRYRYPLIQYKVIRKKAALLCINEGTEQIHAYFNNPDYELSIGNKKGELYRVDCL